MHLQGVIFPFFFFTWSQWFQTLLQFAKEIILKSWKAHELIKKCIFWPGWHAHKGGKADLLKRKKRGRWAEGDSALFSCLFFSRFPFSLPFYAPATQAMYFLDAILTSAKCFKLIRMCQPQSSLRCFSRTFVESADSQYKLLSFFSFNIWRKHSIFWPGLISHQQGDAILCTIFAANLKQRISQANSWRKFEVLCVWWILRENFPGRWPEERIPRADWTSYLRRCLWEDFVCELRHFCWRFFLEINFSLDSETHRKFVQLTPNLG